MRILIVGGYGNFGGRLARLLSDLPDVQVLIGGRSAEKARQFVETLAHPERAEAARFDRRGDLHHQLSELDPDIVIDASGPFQIYGTNPFALVEAAINRNVHYLDLADSTEFVLDISRYDSRAKANGVFVLSGASTCPALSAAVARSLSNEMNSVRMIVGGIAPSPFAVVGPSVVEAIASYAGKPADVHRHGKTAIAFPFTETIRRRVYPTGHRPLRNLTYSLINVPDLRLFAREYPDVTNVWFGAAPTPAIYHWLFRVLARAVKYRLIKSAGRFSTMMHQVMNRSSWGPDRGGMFVEVWGTGPDNSECIRSWHLVVDSDHGVFIPTLACSAIVQECLRGRFPPAGARPADRDLELGQFAPLLTKIGAKFGERTEPSRETGPLFMQVLRDAWHRLPLAIKGIHEVNAPRNYHGLASVSRGTSWIARLIGRMMGFPASGTRVSVDVSMDKTETGETWTRNFSGHQFSSTMSYHANDADWLLWERFGPIRIGMALAIEEERLWYIPQEWSFFRVPLPRTLLPSGQMYESVVDDRFNFHVEIRVPLAGHVVTYDGWLQDASAS